MNKTAIAPLFTTLATKVAPALARFAAKEINPATAKAVGSMIGGAIGGAAGQSAAPDGSKAKGFAVGAITGAAAGFYGGKTVAGFTGKGVDAARLTGLATKMQDLGKAESMTNKTFLKGVGDHIGNTWADPNHLQKIPTGTVAGPAHRPMLGVQTKAPIQKLTEDVSGGSGVTKAIGNMTRNVQGIANGSHGVEGSNVLSRTFKVMKHEANEARYYTKDGFKYKRSLAGQAMGVTLGSGLGIGAFEGATATNNDGTPASTPKKLLKGTTSALSWGLATPVMGAKAIAYDIPKMIINPES